MKQFLLTAAFLLFTFIGFGQCPTAPIVLNSQAEVDNFPITYPNCTYPPGLNISGSDITDLSPLNQIVEIDQLNIIDTSLLDFAGLENLEAINQQFWVFDNQNLMSFEGLGNLAEITGNVQLSDNSSLQNLEGLNQLTELSANLNIVRNNSMTDVNGLENILVLGGFIQFRENPLLENIDALVNVSEITGSVAFFDNNSLTSLDGLQNVQVISNSGDLKIESNDALENLDGLSNVSFLNGRIEIIGNPLLTTLGPLSNLNPSFILQEIIIENNALLSKCDISAICENFDNSAVTITIANNASGCNSNAEVEIECAILDVPDTNFLNTLLNHNPVIDTNADDLIQFDEAEAYTGTLEVAEKAITDFRGLEAFVNITGFNGGGNFSDFLSLQNNTMLNSVDFSGSPDLAAVNLKNGNNMGISSFNAIDCPSLEFICVDDVPFAEANFTNVDPQVQFVDDCEFLSVPAFNLEEAVTVFPNPVSETLTISMASTFNYIKSEVYSVGGQKLLETSGKQIWMGDLSAGIYFVKVISEEGSITKKIIKK
tara:strand:+ start:135466 stop:137091 length:1626 start_codon:yes stop_codon:yes gene_type:complete